MKRRWMTVIPALALALTMTLNGKGVATAVLVSASSGFGGRFMPKQIHAQFLK